MAPDLTKKNVIGYRGLLKLIVILDLVLIYILAIKRHKTF